MVQISLFITVYEMFCLTTNPNFEWLINSMPPNSWTCKITKDAEQRKRLDETRSSEQEILP